MKTENLEFIEKLAEDLRAYVVPVETGYRAADALDSMRKELSRLRSLTGNHIGFTSEKTGQRINILSPSIDDIRAIVAQPELLAEILRVTDSLADATEID